MVSSACWANNTLQRAPSSFFFGSIWIADDDSKQRTSGTRLRFLYAGTHALDTWAATIGHTRSYDHLTFVSELNLGLDAGGLWQYLFDFENFAAGPVHPQHVWAA